MYLRQESLGAGIAMARLLRRADEGPALYDYYGGRGEAITLLLNGVDCVDPTIGRLQDQFCIPYKWRRDDTVATLSPKAAGIGYHAGREDGFIVQIRGIRQWRVWSPELLSTAYMRALCGHPNFADSVITRPAADPIISCVLQPGDALYIPALFPHEGITREESLSLSVAWRGMTFYEVLMALHKKMSNRAADRNWLSADEAEGMGLFRLVSDPPPDQSPYSFLCRELMQVLSPLDSRFAPALSQVPKFVAALIDGAL